MTHPPRLIGLYSPAPRSGKSTVASYLNNHGFYTVSFADPLKRMIRTFLIQLGYGPAAIDHYLDAGKATQIPSIRITPRQLLQTLGTEWGRTCVHPEVWLMCWERIAKRNLAAGVPVICDDVRFPNEAALIRSLGGEMWKITRPATERGTSHSSEGSLDDYPYFDRHLINSGSLTDLYATVQRVVTPITGTEAA